MTTQEKIEVIKDRHGKELRVGDQVMIEQAWEDARGYYHDECVEIAKILPDGSLKFRLGHWKKRSARDQMIQAWLNKFDWHGEDVEKV